MAKEGSIAENLCGVLQYFAYDNCGCGFFNPFFDPNPPNIPPPVNPEIDLMNMSVTVVKHNEADVDTRNGGLRKI